uniref:Gtpase activating protein n=1 Tax=Macrostomum lignano TaxID=282301 RepID=A0A1I8FSJ8_9PLAT
TVGVLTSGGSFSLSGVGNTVASSAGGGAVGAASGSAAAAAPGGTANSASSSSGAGYSLHQSQGNRAHGTCKIGYLMKRSEGKVKRVWQKRRATVDEDRFLLYHADESKPPVSLLLLTCQVRQSPEDRSKRAFRLISNNRTYYFQCDSGPEAEHWVSVLNNAKEKVFQAAMGAPLSSGAGVDGSDGCCGIHRDLGVHISRTQSLVMDDLTTAQLLVSRFVGNKMFNEVFEAVMPRTQQLMDTRKIFIRVKYVDRCYVFRTVETSSDSPDSVEGLQSLKSDLLKAVRHQNMPLLLQAFAEGCDLLAQYSNGETAVHILLREGDESICLAIVDFILQNSPASALKRGHRLRSLENGNTAIFENVTNFEWRLSGAGGVSAAPTICTLRPIISPTMRPRPPALEPPPPYKSVTSTPKATPTMSSASPMQQQSSAASTAPAGSYGSGFVTLPRRPSKVKKAPPPPQQPPPPSTSSTAAAAAAAANASSMSMSLYGSESIFNRSATASASNGGSDASTHRQLRRAGSYDNIDVIIDALMEDPAGENDNEDDVDNGEGDRRRKRQPQPHPRHTLHKAVPDSDRTSGGGVGGHSDANRNCRVAPAAVKYKPALSSVQPQQQQQQQQKQQQQPAPPKRAPKPKIDKSLLLNSSSSSRQSQAKPQQQQPTQQQKATSGGVGHSAPIASSDSDAESARQSSLPSSPQQAQRPAAAAAKSTPAEPITSKDTNTLTRPESQTLEQSPAPAAPSSVAASSTPVRCVAMYDCQAEFPNELSFAKGEVLRITRQENEDWW